MSREENASLVETICLEVPNSMMKLGELDVLATNACTLSLYPLNLILLPSSLSYQERRCYSSPGVRSACQFASSCRRFQDDIPYCSMHTCSFLLCYSSFGNLDPWGSSRDLFLSFFCSGGFLAFFFPFESTLESPATRAWSLDGLMVPIVEGAS